MTIPLRILIQGNCRGTSEPIFLTRVEGDFIIRQIWKHSSIASSKYSRCSVMGWMKEGNHSEHARRAVSAPVLLHVWCTRAPGLAQLTLSRGRNVLQKQLIRVEVFLMSHGIIFLPLCPLLECHSDTWGDYVLKKGWMLSVINRKTFIYVSIRQNSFSWVFFAVIGPINSFLL